MKKLLLLLSLCLLAMTARAANAPMVTNSTTLWLDPKGNDATAVRGIREFPWKTPEIAAGVAVTGDTLNFGPGAYYSSNYWKVPTNGAAVGAGIGSTVVFNYYTNSTVGLIYPLVNLQNNSLLRGMSIVAGYTNLPRYQAAYGNNQAVVVGVTNARVESVWANGDSDVFYISNANPCNITLVNPVQRFRWDANALLGGAAHQVDIYLPDSVGSGGSQLGGNTCRFISTGNVGSGTRIRVYGGAVGITNTTSFIALLDGTGTLLEMYGTVITNKNALDFSINDSVSTLDKLVVYGVNTLPTRFQDVDTADDSNITYGTNLINRLVFAGDAASGSGPTLTRYSGSTIAASASLLSDCFNQTKTSNYQVLAAERGSIFDNVGAGGAVTNTLPTAARGLHYSFVVDAAQFLTVKATGSGTIRNGASVSAANGIIFSNSAGSTIHLIAISSTKWVVDSIQGAWTLQ